MSWREFVASLVGSLAWPVTLAAVAVLFRRQLAALLEGPVKRWRAGPVEVEFWEQQAAQVVERVVASAAPAGPEDDEVERLMAVADAAPSAAVMEGFVLVERELRAVAARASIEDADRGGVARLTQEAARSGAITPETAEAISGLTVLRNLAAHGRGEQTTPQRAREFVVLAQAVLYALRRPPARDAPVESSAGTGSQ